MFLSRQNAEPHPSTLLASLLALLLSSPFVEPQNADHIPGMNHVEVKLTLGAGETRLIEIEQQHEEARP